MMELEAKMVVEGRVEEGMTVSVSAGEDGLIIYGTEVERLVGE